MTLDHVQVNCSINLGFLGQQFAGKVKLLLQFTFLPNSLLYMIWFQYNMYTNNQYIGGSETITHSCYLLG